jgi:hypothetical protein
MDKILLSKKTWLEKIYELAYEGYFAEGKKLIKLGIKKGYTISAKNATNIISSCGPIVKYSFVKPLIVLGGKFEKNNGHRDFLIMTIGNRYSKNKMNSDHDLYKGALFYLATLEKIKI